MGLLAMWVDYDQRAKDQWFMNLIKMSSQQNELVARTNENIWFSSIILLKSHVLLVDVFYHLDTPKILFSASLAVSRPNFEERYKMLMR